MTFARARAFLLDEYVGLPADQALVDEQAAGRLELADSFKETYAGKPEWQQF